MRHMRHAAPASQSAPMRISSMAISYQPQAKVFGALSGVIPREAPIYKLRAKSLLAEWPKIAGLAPGAVRVIQILSRCSRARIDDAAIGDPFAEDIHFGAVFFGGCKNAFWRGQSLAQIGERTFNRPIEDAG